MCFGTSGVRASCRWLWRQIALSGACLAFVFVSSVAATAQSTTSYPSRPARIFVPYGPGGVGDLTMRLLAQKLSELTKQQFVIENRPGAGGSLSAKAVLRVAGRWLRSRRDWKRSGDQHDTLQISHL